MIPAGASDADAPAFEPAHGGRVTAGACSPEERAAVLRAARRCRRVLMGHEGPRAGGGDAHAGTGRGGAGG